MTNTQTPFEKFQDLAKTVVNVPKKEVVKLEQKRKAKKKTKKRKIKNTNTVNCTNCGKEMRQSRGDSDIWFCTNCETRTFPTP
jgi:NADH pyrophosphatase NudC (nudix superfamily)